MKKSTINLQSMANFTWFWDDRFFLETDHGNFVWSDPRYGGDNTITPYDGGYEKYCQETNVEYGRSKGLRTIESFCGKDVIFKI